MTDQECKETDYNKVYEDDYGNIYEPISYNVSLSVYVSLFIIYKG